MQKKNKTSKNTEVAEATTTQQNTTQTQNKTEVKKMAVDLDAIRRKLAQLSGQNKTRDSFWKPEKPQVGRDVQVTIRLLPFPNNEGQPFKERWFYYGLGKNGGLLAPNQFGKKDPINDLIQKLREDDYEGNKALLKLLYPKMRAFAPVIIRGEEDKGPKLWSFGKNVYQQILNIILNEDYGDITDVEEGRDLKVTFTRKPNTEWDETTIVPRPKTCVLSDDQKLAQKWIAEIPNLDDIYTLKTPEELEGIVNASLASDSVGSAPTEAVGEDRPAAAAKTKPAAREARVADDLDAAFADIIGD